ncbi:MAG: hypothetical protein MAG794_01336 [Gammaproteobacteria bacterium]|nr:hypothetical protein [Gammaproteobacteria bacterium]
MKHKRTERYLPANNAACSNNIVPAPQLKPVA